MNYLRLCQLESSDSEMKTLLQHCGVPVTPQTLQILKREIQEKKRIIQSETCQSRSLKRPHDYQMNVARYMLNHRGLILYHQVGFGKTLTSILASQCYLDRYPTHRVLVITPAGLKANFVKEMYQTYGNLLKKNQYFIYSFEKFVKESQNGNINCHNAFMIIDEAHNLRNFQGIRSKEILKCAENAHRILLLTGTPVYNHQNDLIPLYNMIRPFNSKPVYPDNFDLNVLKCKISVRRHEVGKRNPKFPLQISHDIYLDMSPQFLNLYNDRVAVILAGQSMSEIEPERLQAFYNAVRRAVNDLEDEHSQKIQYVYRAIKDHPTEKIIVYSHFLEAGNKILERLLGRDHIPYGYIEGSMSFKKRTEIVRDYNLGNIKVLLLSKAGGEGLDLKETNRVYLLEPSWNEANENQVIGRAIRYESHQNPNAVVHVYHLYHIKASDRTYFREIKRHLRLYKSPTAVSGSLTNPLDPYTNGFDLFMKVLLEKKQIVLNNILNQLKHLSIEQNKCL